MAKKIPITGFEQGNCCPKCGSAKVVLHMQYPLYADFDMKGKEIIKNTEGKRIYRPSNRLLAKMYKNSMFDFQCAFYECMKCEWTSAIYTP